MTRPLLTAALVFFSLPAFAETYYVDKDAWICEGQTPAIEEVETRAKHGDSVLNNKSASGDSTSEYLKQICKKASISRGMLTGDNILEPPGDQQTNQPVTIMYANRELAFVCNQFWACGYEAPTFDCHYALVSDLRNSNGKSVTAPQLQNEAARPKTISDVVNVAPFLHKNCP